MKKLLHGIKKFLLDNVFWNIVIAHRRNKHLPLNIRIPVWCVAVVFATYLTCLFAKWMTDSFLGSGIFWTSLLAVHVLSCVICRRLYEKREQKIRNLTLTLDY